MLIRLQWQRTDWIYPVLSPLSIHLKVSKSRGRPFGILSFCRVIICSHPMYHVCFENLLAMAKKKPQQQPDGAKVPKQQT